MKAWKWSVIEEKWMPMKRSELEASPYGKAYVYVGDKWIKLIEFTEDDTDGN